MVGSRLITYILGLGLGLLLVGCQARNALEQSPPEATEAFYNPTTPGGVVQSFYDWYLGIDGGCSSGQFQRRLVDRAYHDSKYLTVGLVRHVDELLAGCECLAYDPFLCTCAHAIPTEVAVEASFMNGGTPSVLVRTDLTNHLITLDLQNVTGAWQISNITCTSSPEGSAKAFFTWYLGTLSSRGSGEARSPLLDEDFENHPLLSTAFAAQATAVMKRSGPGKNDPILLAEGIPQAFSVDPGITEGTAVVHELFGPDSVRHLLVTMEKVGYRWLITNITEDVPQESIASIRE